MIIVSGGLNNAYAVIGVSYPAGSTCTCSNGTTTRQASGTTGYYVFQIPYAGDWEVSCTNGSANCSKTINISYQYQCEKVALAYGTILFENGQVNAGLGGNANFGNTAVLWAEGTGTLYPEGNNIWANPNMPEVKIHWKINTDNQIEFTAYGSFSTAGHAYACFINPYNFSGKSKLYVIASASNNECCFGLTSSRSYPNPPNKIETSELTTYEYDLTNFQGTYDIIFRVYATSNYGVSTMKISKIWVE